MKKIFAIILTCINFSVLAAGTPASDKKDIKSNISELPLLFRQNVGQLSNNILFYGSTPSWGGSVAFLKQSLSFNFKRLVEAERKNETYTDNELSETLVWNMSFVNCNTNAKLTAENRNESYTNYLRGGDASRQYANVPDYREIKYNNIYDNIDVKFYGTGNALKYDYILKPGSVIKEIKLACSGIKKLHINRKGDLEIETQWGMLLENIPESYQLIDGEKKEVKVSYRLLNDSVFGFALNGNYNNNYDLVIDPVNLQWGTFIGNPVGYSQGYQYDIDVDAAGNIYGTGWFEYALLTTPGAYDMTYGGNGQQGVDVYVYKLNPAGTNFVYCTYVGDSSYEAGTGIVVNAKGEAFVTGYTLGVGANISSFPVTVGALQTAPGPPNSADAIIFKLNATGSALIYSTFLGGSGRENGGWSFFHGDIAVNAADEAFVTGYTQSTNFPVTGGSIDNTANGGFDAFVTKINAAGSGILYSGYIGGSGNDSGVSIAVNSLNEVFITGWTNSANFPTKVGAFDQTYNGAGVLFNGGSFGDVFVVRINTAGSAFIYSTLIGGSAGDEPGEMAINSADEAFICGYTGSVNFPTVAGSYDLTKGGVMDAFVFKLNSTGSGLIYSTYLGGTTPAGNAYAAAFGIAINSVGEAFVGAMCYSTNFPTTSCAYDNSTNGAWDLCLCKFNSTGTSLLYSTYVGGENDDYNYPKVKLYSPCEDKVYLSGTSHSVTNFPVTAGSLQPVHAWWGDEPVLVKFAPSVTPNFTNIISCNTVSFSDASTGNCVWKSGSWSPTSWTWDFGDGTTSTLQNPSHTYGSSGTYNVKLIVSCPKDSITKTVNINSCGIIATTTTAKVCPGACATITATGSSGTGPYTYSWSTGVIMQNISPCPVSSTTYTVTVSDAGGATASSTAVVTVNPGVNVTASPTNLSCNGDSNGSALANPAGGTLPYTYNWSNGQTTKTATGLIAGNYTVTVTDANSCTETVIATLISPPPFAGQFAKGTSNCVGCGCKEWIIVNATGGTSPYSYSWPSSAGYDKRYLNRLCPGTYAINITDKNGCIVNVSLTAP